MRYTKSTIAEMLVAAGLAWGGSAAAAPAVGISASGCADQLVCADLFYASNWTNFTDTGVDEGAFVAGSTHTFTTQAAISGTSLNGTPNTPLGLNFNQAPFYELTKEAKFTDLLSSLTVNPDGSTTFNFLHQDQGDAINLRIFLDVLGDGSQAVRAGPTGADCYGSGPCANDGIEILSARLIGNVSSFTSPSGLPGVGNGSFQLTFEIVDFDEKYVNLDNMGGSKIFSDIFTGTLVQPANEANLGFPPPAHMWDGTSIAGNQLFKVDSSQTFGVIPEPGTLALVGIAFASFGFSRRSKRQL